MDRQLRGIPASPGIVVGHVHLLRWEVPDVRHRIIPDENVHDEIDRLYGAVERAKERATGNVNPQLITSELLRDLEALLA